MFFIYVRELQEEASMDNKKHWKRGKETYTGIHILFYIMQRIQGKINHQRKRSKKEDQ
jgi:hypothetical protein